jgi:hypothetical protein
LFIRDERREVDSARDRRVEWTSVSEERIEVERVERSADEARLAE